MFELSKLPFDKDYLEPYISKNTIEYHYGKHHQGYVNKLNELITGTEWERKSLEEIIIDTRGKEDLKSIFNNAAQVFNHSFFWNSLKKNTVMSDKVEKMLIDSFGSLEEFKNKFKQVAVSQFGSGWAWLVRRGDKLEILSTSNAETMVGQDVTPLLTIDVWEHAYYLDYQNRRPDFVDNILNNLLNWDLVNERLI